MSHTSRRSSRPPPSPISVRLRSARTGRSVSRSRIQPIDADVRERGPVAPRGQGGRRCRPMGPRERGRPDVPAAGHPPRPHRCRRAVRPQLGRAAAAAAADPADLRTAATRRAAARRRPPRAAPPPARRPAARDPSARTWKSAQMNAPVCSSAIDRHGQLRPEEPPDAEPVADRIEGRIRGRVERGQDHVHVRERGDGEHDVGHPPARRDREQDRAQHEEREPVAFVDAGRQHEERQRHDAQDHEQGQSIGVTGGDPQQDDERRDQQHGPDRDRRHDRRTRPRPRCTGRGRDGGGVADPQATAREAVAEVARHDGPGVERVDGQVRVAAAGLDDLVDEAGCEERGLRDRLQHRQAERQAQHDRRQEAGHARREDPHRPVGPPLPRSQPLDHAVAVGRRAWRHRRPWHASSRPPSTAATAPVGSSRPRGAG